MTTSPSALDPGQGPTPRAGRVDRRTVLVVLVAVGVVAAAVTALAGMVLADAYRPHAGGFSELSPSARRSQRWTNAHELAGAVLLATTATLVVLLVTARRDRLPIRRTGLALAASIVAFLTALTTLVTRPMVEWDQLALWAVTAGHDLDGYWTAAFGSGVRFVLVDGMEVTRSQYAPVLVVHLLAPLVAGSALLIMARLRRRTPVRSAVRAGEGR